MLGQRDELVGRDDTALGVLPSHQRFDADHLAGAEVDLGLVVHEELAALDAATQLAKQRQPLERVVVVLGVVDDDALVLLLGDIHRDVGALQQGLCIVAVDAGDDQAHAVGDVELHAFDPGGFCEGGVQAPGLVERAGNTVDRGQQDRELVAAQSRHRVGFAQCLRQSRVDLRQQLVADVMIQGVVHLLEAVEVDQQ